MTRFFGLIKTTLLWYKSNNFYTFIVTNCRFNFNIYTLKIFLTSAKLPQVLTTPTRKNNTSSAYPIACNEPWIFWITVHIVPPLKVSGDCVMSCHISAGFPFQVSSAFCRFCTTQLSDTGWHLLFWKYYRRLFYEPPVCLYFLCVNQQWGQEFLLQR